VVAPGEKGTLTAAVEAGLAGLVVYDLTEPADGVTEDGLTFRQSMPGVELHQAVIGDLGETELTMSVTLPTGVIGIDLYRVATDQGKGIDRDYWGTWNIDGSGGSGSTCGDANDDGRDYDIGSGGVYFRVSTVFPVAATRSTERVTR
jgi:hypothetical protein